MERRPVRTACFSVFLGAALGLGAPAAFAGSAAEPPPGAAASGAQTAEGLVLTVSPGSAAWPPSRVVVLQCSPAGGTHPKAQEACKTLRGVGGDITKLKASAGAACPFSYDPVTVASVGIWGGHSVSSLHTYGNACELRNTLGAVGSF